MRDQMPGPGAECRRSWLALGLRPHADVGLVIEVGMRIDVGIGTVACGPVRDGCSLWRDVGVAFGVGYRVTGTKAGSQYAEAVAIKTGLLWRGRELETAHDVNEREVRDLPRMEFRTTVAEVY